MNSQNLPVEQMLYKPYGSEYDPKLVASTGPAWASFTASSDLVAAIPLEATRHRYAGQYLDPETGLYYYRARYYDPKLGRFVSPDSLFIINPEFCTDSPIECNLYSYTSNNPHKYNDESGNFKVEANLVKTYPLATKFIQSITPEGKYKTFNNLTGASPN